MEPFAMDGAFQTNPTVADQVRAIIARQAVLPLHEVQPEARLDSLGLDSLGLVETLFALEETFDISVPFNANAAAGPGEKPGFDTGTVGAIIAGVEALIAAR
jgi:acyl carrier protein